MPRLSRLYIKTSFVYLAIGLLAGILLAGQSIWPGLSFLASFYPEYIHLLTVGWLTLLIFGVAWWMFPKYTLAQPHGPEWHGWVAYFLINTGLVMRVLLEPLLEPVGEAGIAYALATAAALQWLGGILFIVNLWQRAKVK